MKDLTAVFASKTGIPIESIPEELRTHPQMSTAASRINKGQSPEDGAAKLGGLSQRYAKQVGAVCLYQLTPCLAVTHADGVVDVFWDGLFCLKDGSVVPGPSHGDLTRVTTGPELRREIRQRLRFNRVVGKQPEHASEWRHSNGEIYTVMGLGVIKCRDNPIDGCPAVVYSGPDGLACRPLSEFTDGTFSRVDPEPKAVADTTGEQVDGETPQ